MLPILLAFLLSSCLRVGHAETFEIPGDFSSITLALEATNPHDTVWVHPGTYQERLIFPAHDVVLISDYFMTGDTTAINSTIIDASIFADLDTASVLTFVHGNSRATKVSGFTLTGGHGIGSGSTRTGGCLFISDSHPSIEFCRITGNQSSNECAAYLYGSFAAISHCEIFENCGGNGVVGMWYNFLLDSAVIEWNDFHHNYGGCGHWGPYLLDNPLTATYCNVLIRYNRFHDYEGWGHVGIELYATQAEIIGNTFENITAQPSGMIIMITHYPNLILDNVFRNCSLGNESCVMLEHSQNNDYSLIERNWFESIVNTLGPTCLWMANPDGDIRDNVFLNCVGYVGAVQFSQMYPRGCDVTFERNQFYYNQAVGWADWTGSAFSSAGDGPPCTFVNNWFEGNEGWAIYLDTTITPEADMSNNYWGDPSGPFHQTENPFGLGDSVPANVHVTPWLTAPPGMNEAMEERLALKPEDWSLESAYPNPFNAVINLRLTSTKPQPFEVTAYNTLGQRVAQVWQGVVSKDAATTIHWNGTGDRQQNVASGIYYLVVMPRGPGARAPKSMKVVLLR